MKPYYHFVGNTLRDGRPIPPDGQWLIHKGPLIMCKSGLHASPTPWYALQYAPGPILCEVELASIFLLYPNGVFENERQDLIIEEDKVVASHRKIIRRVDLTEVCWYFARQQAISVIHLWEAPEIVKEFLKTGNLNIRSAAKSAAESAAGASTWDAAKSAARAAAVPARASTTWGAAKSAAESAAWAATWATAESAARAAAESAAWAATVPARASTTWGAAKSTAWVAAVSAVRATTWDAARAAARTQFNQLAIDALPR